MDFLIILSVLLFIAYLQVGLYVLLRNAYNPLNHYFFFLCLCFSLWSFSYIFVYASTDAQAFITWDSYAALGYLLFPAMMVGFYAHLCDFPTSVKGKRKLVFLFVFLGLILFIMNVSAQWHTLKQGPSGWYYIFDQVNAYSILLYIYIGMAIAASLVLLFHWRRKITEKWEICQYKLVVYPLIAFLLPAIVIDFVSPVFFNIKNIPYMGHIFSSVWICGISIAIIKFQLLGNIQFLIGEQLIDHIREIVIFVDPKNKIVRTNHFTAKLLQEGEKSLKGTSLKNYFLNQNQLLDLLKKIHNRSHFGPVNMIMKSQAGNELDVNLYFLSVRNNYDDILGCVIYGYDNRESLNLQKEILIRQHAEKNLRAISEILETRVKERTNELANSYKELQVKMTERMRVEEQIKSDIAEKEILINEIHNRVKSNMNVIISIIQTQNKAYLGAVAFAKFEELAQRVRNLLLVHQNLYLSINYSDVDFAGYLKSIAHDLVKMYKKQDVVELRIEASEVFLDVDYAIPLGIIVNELISNSLQHGFSPYFLRNNKDKKHILHIKYTYEQSFYEISISDNGKGFPKKFSLDDLSSNGLPLVEILVKDQIGGHMKLQNSSDGSSITITFHAAK
jgi:two-component sensor histidine kinase